MDTYFFEFKSDTFKCIPTYEAGIYKFTNKVNGKVYVGKSVNPEGRKQSHFQASRKNSKAPLHKAIREYGIENFDWEIIFLTFTEKDAYEFEKHFIKEYDCCVLDGWDKGYNMTRGGEGVTSGDPILSQTVSERNKRRAKEGTNPFAGELGRAHSSKNSRKMLENGTHPFQGERGSRQSREQNLKRIADGTHHFVGENGSFLNKKRLDAGTHNFIQIHECPHCKKIGKGTMMFRWHFDNCKFK